MMRRRRPLRRLRRPVADVPARLRALLARKRPGRGREDEAEEAGPRGGLSNLRREHDRPDPLALPLALLRFATIMAVLFAAGTFPRSSLFEAREIVVRGPSTIPPREVLRLAGIRPGMNLFQVNPDAVGERVRRYPRVRAVRVALHLPQRLEITVVERQPRMALPYQGEHVLLDEDGVAIARAPAAPGLLQVDVHDLALPWIILGEPLPSPGVRLAGAAAAMLPPAVRAETVKLVVDARQEVTLHVRSPRRARAAGGEAAPAAPASTTPSPAPAAGLPSSPLAAPAAGATLPGAPAPGPPSISHAPGTTAPAAPARTMVVRLGGARGLEERIARLPEILEALAARDLAIEYVDLRFGANVVIRPLGAGEAR
ncbi:MAG: FtsQ-type POTRA domain-containing protein [Armatimonadetes bacterium]|nr:FtsQ-type POTRA domain-containing protein [Armatimonadota bacterium]